MMGSSEVSDSERDRIESALARSHPKPGAVTFEPFTWGTVREGRYSLKQLDPNINQISGRPRTACPVCGNTEYDLHPDCLFVGESREVCFKLPFYVLHDSTDGRIFVTVMSPYCELHVQWLPFLRENDFVIFTDFGCVYIEDRSFWREIRACCSFPDNLYFACNTQVAVINRRAAGLNASLVSHNAWLDESRYRITDELKEYDALLVGADRGSGYKRHHLASRVAGLALVVSRPDFGTIPEGMPAHDYISGKSLSVREMVQMYNRSRVTLFLSALEGGCYASSEALLCGTPVVSTHSLGGRDTFYDETNSIICDPDPAAIRDAVEEMIAREANPRSIREGHLEKTRTQRETFVREVIGPIVRQMGLTESPEALYRRNYFKPHRSRRGRCYVSYQPDYEGKRFCHAAKILGYPELWERYSRRQKRSIALEGLRDRAEYRAKQISRILGC